MCRHEGAGWRGMTGWEGVRESVMGEGGAGEMGKDR